MRRTGFTLMEMMMTVTVIAILASVAIPNYTKTVRRAQGKAVRDVLLSIFAGEKARQAASGGYNAIACSQATTACYDEWQQLFMDIPNLNGTFQYFVVNVDNSANPQTFTAQVRHLPNATDFISIDQFGVITCLATSGIFANNADYGCFP